MRARALFEIIAGDEGPAAPLGADHAWRERLSIALDTLSPRQAFVVREWYLREPRPTLAKLATAYEVSDGRIWQIKRRVLEKLRHPSRRWFLVGDGDLTALPWSVRPCWGRSRAEPKPPVRVDGLEPRDRLLLDVQDLEISVRVANCFGTAGIILVGDLVGKTEGDLLRIRNFGRRSLREIKMLLANIDLALGMKIPGWARMRASRVWRTAEPADDGHEEGER